MNADDTHVEAPDEGRPDQDNRERESSGFRKVAEIEQIDDSQLPRSISDLFRR